MNKVVLSLVALAVVVVGVIIAKHEIDRTPTTTTSTSTTSTSTSSTTSTTIAALTACSGSTFTGVMQPGQGAAGTIYATVVLTNTSATPCRVNGWPTLTLFNGAGAVMGSTIIRSSSAFSTLSGVPTAPSNVTVPAQGTVQFALAYSDVPVGNQTVCPTVVTFTVNLPLNLTSSQAVSVDGGSSFAPCGHSQVWVSPLYS